MRWLKYIAIAAVLIIIVVGIHSCSDNMRKTVIKDKVESIGGQYVSHDYNSDFEPDPYPWYKHGKNIHIYSFTYVDRDGNLSKGWVRFGAVQKDWILDSGLRKESRVKQYDRYRR